MLSARHGLVHPDTVWSRTTCASEPTTGPPRRFTHGPQASGHSSTPGWPAWRTFTLVALAGEQYRIAVHNSRLPVEIRMKGLGIGQQLGWLTANSPVNLSTSGPRHMIDAGAGHRSTSSVRAPQPDFLLGEH
ncbi:hypothetical protein [Arthrobacter sp.]|uniref:hypothetical protein n=1 Tax=Arthrobacter sp. TaxID=1667 RepID=UPI0033944192